MQRRCIMQEAAKVQDGLEYFLTYADNAAVGYFEKQGFTREVTMPRERVRPRPESGCWLSAAPSLAACAVTVLRRPSAKRYSSKVVSRSLVDQPPTVSAGLPRARLFSSRGCWGLAKRPNPEPNRAVGGLHPGLRRRHADGVFNNATLNPTAQWVGYIKDYDGGTLMECAIYATLPYLGLPAMVAAQRAALDRRIRALSNAHVVHPGLPPGARPAPIGDIPGALTAQRMAYRWLS